MLKQLTEHLVCVISRIWVTHRCCCLSSPSYLVELPASVGGRRATSEHVQNGERASRLLWDSKSNGQSRPLPIEAGLPQGSGTFARNPVSNHISSNGSSARQASHGPGGGSGGPDEGMERPTPRSLWSLWESTGTRMVVQGDTSDSLKERHQEGEKGSVKIEFISQARERCRLFLFTVQSQDYTRPTTAIVEAHEAKNE